MASIIHQATRPGGEEQAELAALTGNERSRNSSQRGGRGGFLRQLFCCFTGNAAANRYNAEEEVVKDEVTSADKPTKVTPTHDEPQPDIVRYFVPRFVPGSNHTDKLGQDRCTEFDPAFGSAQWRQSVRRDRLGRDACPLEF